ncbi:MAG: hypothetical protein R8M45_06045 [Ghiorsea sp.]
MVEIRGVKLKNAFFYLTFLLQTHYTPMMWVSKNIRQRLVSSVLAVLLLQVIAAGFCVPTAMASGTLPDIKHAVSMQHHEAAPMQHQAAQHHHQSEQDTLACSHCDLPDLILSWDKTNAALAHVVLALIFVQTFDMAQLQAHAAGIHLSPPPLRTSLLTHDLNQRFRV